MQRASSTIATNPARTPDGEGLGLAPEEAGERSHAFFAARRTAVDVCFTAGDGLGVRAATRVAALPALRLRQHGIDRLHHGIVLPTKAHRRERQGEPERERQQREGPEGEQEAHGAIPRSPRRPAP